MANIAVVGEIYSHNVGDNVIYTCIESNLKSLNHDVFPIDLSGRSGFTSVNQVQNPSATKKALRLITRNSSFARQGVSLYRWKKRDAALHREHLYEKIKSADGVIIGGGQLLTNNNLEFPLRISNVCSIAKELKKPYAFFSCGAGSGLTGLARSIYKKCLNEAEFISTRDNYSRSILTTLVNSDKKILINCDPVFFLNKEVQRNTKNSAKVGINIMSLDTMKRKNLKINDLSIKQYYNFWMSLISHLTNFEKKPVLFTNGDYYDFQEAVFLSEYLRENNIHIEIVQRPMSGDELISQMETFDEIVATRMHSAIIGCALRIPTVSIAWEQKVHSVFEERGVGEMVLDSSVFYGRPAEVVLYGLETFNNTEMTRRTSHIEYLSCLNECVSTLERYY